AFEESDSRLEIGLTQEGARYIAEKGSIAVNGISLTVGEVKPASFVTWIIPHTRRYTNLKTAQPGELVNLEFDILAKYVERMVGAPDGGISLPRSYLMGCGRRRKSPGKPRADASVAPGH